MGGLPLEFINIQHLTPLEFINIQPPKVGPPLEFINQRVSNSKFHQLDWGWPLECTNINLKMGLGTISMDLALGGVHKLCLHEERGRW